MLLLSDHALVLVLVAAVAFGVVRNLAYEAGTDLPPDVRPRPAGLGTCSTRTRLRGP